MKQKKLIVAVCRGNVLRSAVTEVLIRRELEKLQLDGEYIVISRGTQGTAVDPKPPKHKNIKEYQDLYIEIKPALDDLEIDLSEHSAKPIDEIIAKKANVLMAVDEQVADYLRKLFPAEEDKIRVLPLELLEGKSLNDSEQVHQIKDWRIIFRAIERSVADTLSKILARNNTKSEESREKELRVGVEERN